MIILNKKNKLHKIKDVEEISLDLNSFHVHINITFYNAIEYTKLCIIQEGSQLHRIVNLWNKLPEPAIDSPNVRIFEGRLDKFLTRYSFKFDTEANFHFMICNGRDIQTWTKRSQTCVQNSSWWDILARLIIPDWSQMKWLLAHWIGRKAISIKCLRLLFILSYAYQ